MSYPQNNGSSSSPEQVKHTRVGEAYQATVFPYVEVRSRTNADGSSLDSGCRSVWNPQHNDDRIVKEYLDKYSKRGNLEEAMECLHRSHYNPIFAEPNLNFQLMKKCGEGGGAVDHLKFSELVSKYGFRPEKIKKSLLLETSCATSTKALVDKYYRWKYSREHKAYHAVRKSVKNHSDQCYYCHSGGHLLCCDACPRAYHLQCLTPRLTAAPIGKWFCPICAQHLRLRNKAPRKPRRRPTTADEAEFVNGYVQQQKRLVQPEEGRRSSSLLPRTRSDRPARTYYHHLFYTSDSSNDEEDDEAEHSRTREEEEESKAPQQVIKLVSSSSSSESSGDEAPIISRVKKKPVDADEESPKRTLKPGSTGKKMLESESSSSDSESSSSSSDGNESSGSTTNSETSYYIPPVLQKEKTIQSKKTTDSDSEQEWDGSTADADASTAVVKREAAFKPAAIDISSIAHIYGQRKQRGSNRIQHLVRWKDDMVEWINSARLGLSRREILALNQRNARERRIPFRV